MARSSRSSRASRPAGTTTTSRRDRRRRGGSRSPSTRSSRSTAASSRSTRASEASRTPLPGSRSARAARRRRRRIRTLTATSAAIVLLLAGITGAWALLRDEGGKAPAQVAAPTTTKAPTTTSTTPPTTTPPPPPQFVVATVTVPQIGIFESPSDAAPVKTTLSNKTEYDIDRVFLVTKQEPAGWLEILLPLKPNGQTGWIHDTDVTRALVSYQIRVDRATHTLQVLNLGQVVFETPVAVGSPSTPTPAGFFYVTDPVPGGGGAYGPWALGLSAYSDVLPSFDGGPPQIAIHGTNHPELIGGDVSNGCVRVPNENITQIHDMVPLGTPVMIV